MNNKKMHYVSEPTYLGNCRKFFSCFTVNGRLNNLIILPVFITAALITSSVQASGAGIFDKFTSSAVATCGQSSCHTPGNSGHTGYSILVRRGVSSVNGLNLSKNIPHTLNLRLQGTGGARGGFNINATQGTFTAGSDSMASIDSTQLTHTDTNGVSLGGGKLASAGDVTWSFTFNAPNVTGSVSFQACGIPVDGTGGTASDGISGSGTLCTDLTAILFNDPPVADDENSTQIGSVTEDTTLNIADSTLLAGDVDINSDALTITGFGSVTAGVSVVDNGASFTYDSVDVFDSLDDLESTTDSFTYTVEDTGGQSDTATVTVTIDGANDEPVAGVESILMNIAATATTLVGGESSVLANDSDVDIEMLSAVLVAGPTPEFGTLTLNLNGTFSYQHDGSNNLSDSFQYRASDGDAFSNTVTVPITISNTAPTSVDDLNAATVLEGGSVNFAVLNNDSDPQTGFASHVVNVTNVVNGLVTIESDQSITFTHDGSETVSASFQYQANDGFLTSTNTASVTLIVTPQNDPPIITQGDSVQVNMSEDSTPVVFSLTLNAGDIEGGDLSWDISSVASNGTASVAGTGNAMAISYSPNLNFAGDDSFIVRVTDNGLLFDTILVEVVIAGADDPPEIAEGENIAVNMSEDGSPDAFSLTLNASDPENDVISWEVLTPAGDGIATVSGTGTRKEISYVPNANFNGSDSFVLRVTANALSDTISVDVTVDPVNDAPLIAQGSLIEVAVSEDGNRNIPLNASDAEGSLLSWSISSVAQNGIASVVGTGNAITINYIPSPDFTGSDSFIVQVIDDTLLTANIQVNITVTPVNDPPVITEASPISVIMNEDDPSSFNLTLNASDVDLDEINWSILSQGSNGVASATGSGTSKVISYVPTAEFNGSDSFVVEVIANAQSDTLTVNVTVNSVLDAPVIAEGDSVLVNMSEDSSPTMFNLTLNASDGDDDEISWEVISTATIGTANVSGIGTSKAISYIPALNQTGSDSFIVRVTDSTGLSDNITVNVAISAIDDAPVISLGETTSVNMSEDSSPVAFALTLDANDTENDPIEWNIASPASSGIASVTTGAANSKVISYTPNSNFRGNDSFDVAVLANAQGDSIRVNVSVASVNDVPVITQGETVTINISEDNDPNAFALTLNATDIENDSLSWSIITAASNGTANVSNSPMGNLQAISYAPLNNFNGSDGFTVQVSDGVSTDSVEVIVNIGAINDAPAITEGSTVAVIMSEDGTPVPFNLSLNATDAENDTINWSIEAVASNGTAAISNSPTGVTQLIDYIPTGEFSGNDSFTVAASDGAISSLITVNVTVNTVNDAPALADINDVTTDESVAMDVITAIGSDPDDANDGVELTYSLGNAPVNMVISNTTGTLGQISWTPPQTGEFDKLYGPISVSVVDGGEDGAAVATRTFSITVKIPDQDEDMVADYDDFCPTIGDSSNADNDGDGTAGSDFDVDDAIGGDACDTDDDNDGMPDAYELANNLDSFDASDAAADKDGDGISNLDEFLQGSNPSFATLTINSTGYLTPVDLAFPEPAFLHPEATQIAVDDSGPYRPGEHILTWTVSSATIPFLLSSEQIINIIPLIKFSANQEVLEGGVAQVQVSINGDAVDYPVSMNYSVRGSSSSSDHDAVAGSVTIEQGSTSAIIEVAIFEDAISDAKETVVLEMVSVTNAFAGSKSRHRIRIEEGNLAPQVELNILQNGNNISTGFITDGEVTVQATVSDQNSGQSFALNWSDTANALLAPADTSTTSWTFQPQVGVYVIDLIATDNGSPSASRHVRKILSISSDGPPVLDGTDTDADGIADDIEGYGDSDNDGIPDYLDSIQQPHLLADQSAILADTHLLQIESGLKLTIGHTARAAGIFGASVTDDDLSRFGSRSGTAVQKSEDDFEHVSGIYDFEISGITPGDSALIVIPLQIAIPRDSEFRKFSEELGWSIFVEDGERNVIFSAPGKLGVCPEPGSNLYQPGLGFLDNCIQLLIEDGGVNDQDKVADGLIIDPATVAFKISAPADSELRQGGVLTLELLMLLLLLGFSRFSLRVFFVTIRNY